MLSLNAEARPGFANAAWRVHKFGGTSVASADCFRVVARIIKSELRDPNVMIAVVLSAMGGKPKTTDMLIETVEAAAERDTTRVDELLAAILHKHQTCLKSLFPKKYNRLLGIINEDISNIRDILKTVSLMKWPAARIREAVSGYGELWSTQILQQLLDGHDNKFMYLDARELIIIDEEAIYDGAVVWETCMDNLKNLYTTSTHIVMTGYVATNTQGCATTLQRDGSDYSAAILGRLLSSDSITIWTDVDGVLSADPRRVPHAQVLPEVSYSEAMELAYFGAKVIHPKTMQPALSSDPPIPIYIRNTFNASCPGSRIYITSTTTKDRENPVCAFSSIEHMAMVNVEGAGMIGVPGVAKRLFGTLENLGVNVVLISQASSEHSITFATTEEQSKLAVSAIAEEFRRELDQSRISNIDVKSPCSIIAAVGDGMSSTTGCAGRFFSALGDAKINIVAIAQGCSERNISAVVHSSESVRALRAVHAAFRLSHTTIRIAIVGMNQVGESLLRLLDEQRAFLRQAFDLDLQVCAVLLNGDARELVYLKNDTDASADSITIRAFNEATHADLPATSQTTFQDERDKAESVEGGSETIQKYLFRSTCTNHVIFDCTNNENVGKHHAEWLRCNIDVVTANNTGLSGSREQREKIHEAEIAFGKQSAKYLREVTVGGGLPVLKTLRSLLDTGDKIHRVDGILSVSMSFIMFRISPPPSVEHCSLFDQESSHGAFNGDVTRGVGTPCSFSQAVQEAIDLGLMEEDPTSDLNNEYTSRVLMVLAKELGLADEVEFKEIQAASDTLFDEKQVDYNNLSAEIDEQVKARVDVARSRGCVLRQIVIVDVRDKTIEIKLTEVPEHHLFAVTPPSCECVRFFTRRHRSYPLVIQGPGAGADSTASALLAELLHLMRGKATPRSVALSRSTSGAVLRS